MKDLFQEVGPDDVRIELETLLGADAMSVPLLVYNCKLGRVEGTCSAQIMDHARLEDERWRGVLRLVRRGFWGVEWQGVERGGRGWS